MGNLVLLFVCLLGGITLRHVSFLPRNLFIKINAFILYVPLPAVILLSLSGLVWDEKFIPICLMSWVVFGMTCVVFMSVGKRMGWEREVIGCLILTAGLGNTSFVGYPIIEALMGKGALKYAVLVDQPGTFLICSSLGLWVAESYSSKTPSFLKILQRILIFPPFVSFVLAVLLNSVGWKAEGNLEWILLKLSWLLAPLALLSVGLQLSVREIPSQKKFLIWGLGLKLIVAPICIFLLYSHLNLGDEVFKVMVLEAAMAPMITSSVLAASYGLAPALAGLMVGVGVPLSFLTLSIWWLFLS